jgi:hypothetical protein
MKHVQSNIEMYIEFWSELNGWVHLWDLDLQRSLLLTRMSQMCYKKISTGLKCFETVSSGRRLWIQRWTFGSITVFSLTQIPQLPWDWFWPITSSSESESELLYDWWLIANQFVLATSLLRLTPSNFIFQLNTCGYSPHVTSSLTRKWVCRLQLLLVIASAVTIGSESRGTHDYILLSQNRDSPNMEGQVPVFISPRKRVGRLYPQALGSFFAASYDSQGYGRGIRLYLHTVHSTSSSSCELQLVL